MTNITRLLKPIRLRFATLSLCQEFEPKFFQNSSAKELCRRRGGGILFCSPRTTAILTRCILGNAKRKTSIVIQGNSQQLCCLHEAKTENSEYEKRRRLHLQSPPLRFDALFSGCQEIRIKKPRTKTIQSEKIDDTRRAEPRFPRDLIMKSPNDRALRGLHLARSRMVNERAALEGEYPGEPKCRLYEKGAPFGAPLIQAISTLVASWRQQS